MARLEVAFLVVEKFQIMKRCPLFADHYCSTSERRLQSPLLTVFELTNQRTEIYNIILDLVLGLFNSNYARQ